MYVGRIVAVGRAARPCVAYRVSSRAFPNRVARLTAEGAAIRPLDPEDLRRNPYIAYHCIRVSANGVVVSNGAHTDPIWHHLEAGMAPDEALTVVLEDMGYERDALHTPRIAGVVTADTGYLGIVRPDAVEVARFPLVEGTCRIICTYELNRLTETAYPFAARSALEAAKYVTLDGPFAALERPICAAAWMDGLAVFNPHEIDNEPKG
mgnify:CR=1 FL=1